VFVGFLKVGGAVLKQFCKFLFFDYFIVEDQDRKFYIGKDLPK